MKSEILGFPFSLLLLLHLNNLFGAKYILFLQTTREEYYTGLEIVLASRNSI